jgi:hypothetical protein
MGRGIRGTLMESKKPDQDRSNDNGNDNPHEGALFGTRRGSRQHKFLGFAVLMRRKQLKNDLQPEIFNISQKTIIPEKPLWLFLGQRKDFVSN